LNILIIANSDIVFAKELKNALLHTSYKVSLLDFASLKLYDCNNQEILDYSNRFSKYKNIPKLSMFVRMFYIKKIMQMFRYDLVNIHTSRWFYLAILPYLSTQKYIISFYGSDFYRTSKSVKNIQKPLYKNAYKLTFTNPMMKESFLNHYHDFEKKSFVCRFGLKTLDYIDKNSSMPQEEIKKKLGYSLDKLIVTCGYNATKAQQHDKIIENILSLATNVKEKVQFIFPMTYGDANNKQRIKNILKETDLDYIVLEDFLYEDNNAYIKLASNIMINILQTDSFSGSMQEFLYAGNHVITGEWLPYDLFEKEGIKFQKIKTENELAECLNGLISKYEDYSVDLDNNKKIINNLSSWKNNIKNWTQVYED